MEFNKRRKKKPISIKNKIDKKNIQMECIQHKRTSGIRLVASNSRIYMSIKGKYGSKFIR